MLQNQEGQLTVNKVKLIFDKGNIENNHAAVDGGGIYAEHCHAIIDNIIFTGNKAQQHGGGFYAMSSVIEIHNSKGMDNTAVKNGRIYYS